MAITLIGRLDRLAAHLKNLDSESGEAKLLRETIAALSVMKKGLLAVNGLISDSRGVAGLHLNGDIAPWESLMAGGEFEDWLKDFDAALTCAEVTFTDAGTVD